MARVTGGKVLLASGAFLAGLVLALLVFREPMEPLSAAALRDARLRWTNAGVTSYEIVYRMNGAEYAIDVRDGVVLRASVGGQRPSSQDWQLYSVEGLFDTLEQELDIPRSAGGSVSPAQPLVMRVRFHAELGYPQRYLRSGSGAVRGATIEVTRFERK